MTTVIWDGKHLAADRAAINGSLKQEARKLYRENGGELFLAFSGSLAVGLIMVDWHNAGADLTKYPDAQKTEDWTRLVVCGRVGRPSVYENHPACMVFEDDYAAWGSGSNFALGALAQGATASQAMEIACRFDPASGIAYDIADLRTGETTTVRLT